MTRAAFRILLRALHQKWLCFSRQRQDPDRQNPEPSLTGEERHQHAPDCIVAGLHRHSLGHVCTSIDHEHDRARMRILGMREKAEGYVFDLQWRKPPLDNEKEEAHVRLENSLVYVLQRILHQDKD